MIEEEFSHYRIIKKLGAGGMGEVYLAEDTILNRRVALKLLSPEHTQNEEHLRRFKQEAKSVSALNHPNILTIHEVGEADGHNFIATEFIDGETLFAALRRTGKMKTSEALNVAAQAASALAAAHEAGIVHRDIKPENIMLRRDGYVKVLDFGLAKLTEKATSQFIDGEAPTRPLALTQTGAIVGTAKYMSPEQARGLAFDSRTDIWSLGCVLYEMVAGRAPFAGDTVTDMLVAIVGQEPPPLKDLASEQIPVELDWIITKTLRKNPDERYQMSKELLIDLQRLRQQLEIESHLERSTTTDASGTATTASLAATRLAPRRVVIIAAVLLALTLSALAYVWRWKQPTALSFQTAKFARLTSTGKALGAAISPDGKWLVYVQDDGAQKSLWLRQVAVPNSNTQIVPPADGRFFWGLAFSPDGNYIYYSASEEDGLIGALHQTPVLGGTTRKLATGVESSVAFSPDGKQIAYFAYFQDGEDELWIANADGTGARQLAVRRGDEYFYNGPFNGVSWSPDGKTIVTPVGNHVESYMSVAAVSVASGEVKLLTPRRWRRVRQVAWLGDGSRLLVTAQEQGTETFNIWQLSYSTGEAQKLTNDLNSYPFFSFTADARLLAAVQTERASNIWVLPAFDAAQAKPITQGLNYVGLLSWTPDGRIVYSSNASGNPDLYAIDARGGDAKQLTTSPAADRQPAVSPDGRSVVFASDRAGRLNLWRMDIDGANAKQLTDQTDAEQTLSPDGRWVVYTSVANKMTLWKLALDGGPPQQLTEKTVISASFSPDGKKIACFQTQEVNAPYKLAILSFADGQIIKTFDQTAGQGTTLRWTVDGRALVYSVTVGGVSNLWAQPVDGSPPKQLTNFTAERIFGFDLSRDGKQLALSRGTAASDVVLISDFK
jgi:Tol biopolymer transport system component/tRNA A-37 threonylcarbamoyl transferase component Bud32